jgi:hypothetical protein
MRPVLPALATLLALIHYLVVIFNVGRARLRYGIEAPATSGPPAFERAYRVQMNTLEQLVAFVPALWLFTWFVSPTGAGVLGLVWVAGRAWYAWSYYRDPGSRGAGFMVAMTATMVLVAGSLVGIVLALGRTGL